MLFGRGILLVKDGKVVGAVDASGSSAEHNVKVAKAAVKLLKSISTH
nr:heme-binding protein [Planococcus glaciei]